MFIIEYDHFCQARVPAAAPLPADSPADPLSALEAVIRQAAVLTRAAREHAAGLDPARVRAQIADAKRTLRALKKAGLPARSATIGNNTYQFDDPADEKSTTVTALEAWKAKRNAR